MKPGVGHILAGIALLAVGVGLTMASTNTVFYGAILVGVYYIGRGVFTLVKNAGNPPEGPNG